MEVFDGNPVSERKCLDRRMAGSLRFGPRVKARIVRRGHAPVAHFAAGGADTIAGVEASAGAAGNHSKPGALEAALTAQAGLHLKPDRTRLSVLVVEPTTQTPARASDY